MKTAKKADLKEADVLVYALADDLSRLLKSMSLPKDAAMRREMEELKAWLSARKDEELLGGLAPDDAERLRNVHARLKVSADESQRLEGEGGAPASGEQAQIVEDMLKVMRHIDRILEHNA